MTKAAATLIASFFMSKKGSKNRVLKKIGIDNLAKILESTFKDGGPTLETLETIASLNGGKKTKQVRDAERRLSDPKAYNKDNASFVLQDIIAPAISGIIKTGGNVAALQQQALPAALQAAANSYNIDPRVQQGSLAGQMQAANVAATPAAMNIMRQAKAGLIKGLADVGGNTINNAAMEKRKENETARLNQRIQDMTTVQGSAPSSAYFDLLNRQARNQQRNAEAYASGEF